MRLAGRCVSLAEGMLAGLPALRPDRTRDALGADGLQCSCEPGGSRKQVLGSRKQRDLGRRSRSGASGTRDPLPLLRLEKGRDPPGKGGPACTCMHMQARSHSHTLTCLNTPHVHTPAHAHTDLDFTYTQMHLHTQTPPPSRPPVPRRSHGPACTRTSHAGTLGLSASLEDTSCIQRRRKRERRRRSA